MTHTNLIDPYKVLGIPHDASDQDIKRAYKKAALQHHPDRNVDKAPSCETETKMALINEAYSVLKDEDRKKEYDHWHRYGGGGGGVPVCDFDNDYIPSTQPHNSSVHDYSSRYQKNDSSFKNNDEEDEDDEEEMHFQINPGLNPFLFINVPRTSSKRTRSSSSNTSSFTFAFSSMSTQYTKDGKSKIYTRKYTQYYDGWKHTQIETATVDEFGHTVYKRSMTHEKSKLQNLRDLVSSFLKRNPISLPKTKGNTRGDPSTNSYSPQAHAETATSSSNNHNHNEATNGGWAHQVMNQVRKCTGTCGGLLSLSDYSS